MIDSSNVQISGISDPVFQIVCQRMKLEAEKAYLESRIKRKEKALIVYGEVAGHISFQDGI